MTIIDGEIVLTAARSLYKAKRRIGRSREQARAQVLYWLLGVLRRYDNGEQLDEETVVQSTLSVSDEKLEEFCLVIETGVETLAGIDPDFGTDLLDWVEAAREYLSR